RLGGEMPKQYRDLGGRPVLRHSLATFASHPLVGAVRTVIHPDDRFLYDQAAAGLKLPEPVSGGETRQDSVRLGLESLAGEPPDLVLIHDGARPFVDSGIITRVIGALACHPGAIPALAVADTLKRGADGRVTATVERAGLWRAQTPQGFRYGDILAAHRAAAGLELTDDAAVAEWAGLGIALVPGSEDNVKLTTAEDMARAVRLFTGPGDIRVGTGYDVHRFVEGSAVTLCGIEIPHEMRLAGHSDADVALHAVTDALLGAIGAGDIGHHFPPSDPQWRGGESHLFLRHAVALVAALGGEVRHVDITIVCERPKIGPHRMTMALRLAEILGVRADRVSVKATTTEGLGFAGRREGIEAQAVATVWLPR
ncbi:MAG: bifunctional 2-C-methyl-D-erythritol 4-phosphate cytidylyltransferase/2-C-methyl-D-erythritol 2,4-cyclodiphosphate synthase, partial [Rhodospirillales bacterium]|nr:bifunctional 2-C-methyl-D-erythritol 4-phosphate cytidylyltransferase/2-C-methyl-D-erythritol 2,4-cyclodiphosphate synthase [Rhodospirillales bacterium]